MKKKLVAYFSASGVTKKAAERIAKIADADIFEIKPTEPYTDADLNWQDKKSRSSVEMSDPMSRPEIAVRVEDMEQYETVIIGFPIWLAYHKLIQWGCRLIDSHEQGGL